MSSQGPDLGAGAPDAILGTQFSALGMPDPRLATRDPRLATRDPRPATSSAWPTELGVELSGLAAAEAALEAPSGPSSFPDTGVMVYRVFGIELARTATPGWLGDPARATRRVIEASGRSPIGRPAKVRLVVWHEPDSGRLLAAQVAGREGSAARVRVLTTAIHAGLRLTDLADLDLDLAPGPGQSRSPLAAFH